jgi:hypothetical protein
MVSGTFRSQLSALVWKNIQLRWLRLVPLLLFILPFVLPLLLYVFPPLPLLEPTQHFSSSRAPSAIYIAPDTPETQAFAEQLRMNNVSVDARIVESASSLTITPGQWVTIEHELGDQPISVVVEAFYYDSVLNYLVPRVKFNNVFSVPSDAFSSYSHVQAMCLAFFYVMSVGNISFRLVSEKADGFLDLLKSAGVSETSWMLSWALTYAIPSLVQALILSFLFSGISFFYRLLIVVFFVLFFQSLFAFVYMCTAFYPSSRWATPIICLLYTVPIILSAYGPGNTVKWLFPWAPFTSAVESLFRQDHFQYLRAELNSTTLVDEVPWSDANIWPFLFLLIFYTFMYVLIAAYRRHDSRSGTFPPLDFILNRLSIRSKSPMALKTVVGPPQYVNPERFEPRAEDDDECNGIRIRSLRKTFLGGSIVAVSDLDIDVCSQPSSALLC